VNTYTQSFLTITLSLAITFFGFVPFVQAGDTLSRVTVTINESNVSAQPARNGKLETRLSGEQQTTRLKITPIEVKHGRILVLIPLDDVSGGFNVISVPARFLDQRESTTGKLQAR
jgi:hypothetical protein